MKIGFCFLIISILFQAYQNKLPAQHTFSIVAVDTMTGEVGGAGATCLSLDREGYQALIISHLLPGVGALHTQSYWHPVNQGNGSVKLEEGLNAQELLNWLVINDAEGNPSIRQYGAAVLGPQSDPTAAGYTGANCLNSKKHVAGRYYSIQGNILIGNYVIDSMEARFLRSSGSLADRLMEAMRAAKIPGADSRCLNEGLSSRSSFIRVARPTDLPGEFFLDISVGSVRRGLDPIDSLDTRYEAWKTIQSNADPKGENTGFNFKLWIQGRQIIVESTVDAIVQEMTLFDQTGQAFVLQNSDSKQNIFVLPDVIKPGTYVILIKGMDQWSSRKLVIAE
ncbi:MAG: DUF1028 domain-containing protein [Saprospiraceae bacterium]|nr:DUF1028 domain-containing protein [Saprospiraceae bacterium]